MTLFQKHSYLIVFILIMLPFTLLAQKKDNGGIPEGKSIEQFAFNRLILHYDTLTKGKHSIIMVTGKPINKLDFSRVWIKRVLYHNENETDFTLTNTSKVSEGMIEYFYIGRIDTFNAIYFPKQLQINGCYLFVCVGKNQERIFYYKGTGWPISIPCKDFYLTPKKDKIYTRTSDKTYYQFNVNLEIIKELNYFPPMDKSIFYNFPECDKLK